MRVVGRVRVWRRRRHALAVFLLRLHRLLRWSISAETVWGRCDASTAILIRLFAVWIFDGAVRELGRGVVGVLASQSYASLAIRSRVDAWACELSKLVPLVSKGTTQGGRSLMKAALFTSPRALQCLLTALGRSIIRVVVSCVLKAERQKLKACSSSPAGGGLSATSKDRWRERKSAAFDKKKR